MFIINHYQKIQMKRATNQFEKTGIYLPEKRYNEKFQDKPWFFLKNYYTVMKESFLWTFLLFIHPY